MVKRTGEVVMGIIGIVLSALFSIIGIVTNMSIDDPMVMQEMEKMIESDPAITTQDSTFIIGIAESMGWYLILIGVIASILGLIAVLTIVKNRKPILSGIMFILAALVIGLGTIGFGFIPGLLFLIAGIMAFVRKPKPSETVY
ncbi:Protein of unknown function [[Bacillus] enclensis]|jgi:predicted transcriptional regulator|uniref:DUF4064 domain-containing protein n=1 Tax=[Bacillus] enclensis TaxID=1402860 RepID=A0A1C4BS89_9BACI|nr:DUF4064 domain-containing protein [[Bacillus] enclensis]MBH9965160.1 DUF4064 domain-containing protein [[Bacillus] enclensis]SCC09598.1 Protein of unknown function [[Bacillus] enclensis]